MSVSTIPGYLQGFVFENDPQFYDSVGNVFLDQSPFASWSNNHLQVTEGTPSFVALGSGEGVTLDNTLQGFFLCPIAWEGALIAVMKPSMGSNGLIHPVIFGGAASVASNSRVSIVRVNASLYRHSYAAASAVSVQQVEVASDVAVVSALGFSQETRKAYATADGVTVSEGSAVSDSGAGVFAFSSATENVQYGFRARFGNISGTIGDTTATGNTATLFELHFFAGNPMLDAADEVQAAISELKAKYGL